jgi:hypothetical protein
VTTPRNHDLRLIAPVAPSAAADGAAPAGAAEPGGSGALF